MNIDRMVSPEYGLTDIGARIVAAGWQSGGDIPLASLASTGAIVPGIGREIRACLNEAGVPAQRTLLALLAAYCAEKGYRGRQDGWHILSWSGADEGALSRWAGGYPESALFLAYARRLSL